MASLPSYCLSFSLAILVIFNQPAMSDKQIQEWINKICRQMEEFGFCNQTFNANLKSPSMDLAGLTQLTIQLTMRKAISTCACIQSILHGETTPDVIKSLKECVKDYQLVVEAFHEASNAFGAGNYRDMLRHESRAPKAVFICKSGFNFKPFPVHPFSFLIEENRKLRILVAMSIVTGHYLVLP